MSLLGDTLDAVLATTRSPTVVLLQLIFFSAIAVDWQARALHVDADQVLYALAYADGHVRAGLMSDLEGARFKFQFAVLPALKVLSPIPVIFGVVLLLTYSPRRKCIRQRTGN